LVPSFDVIGAAVASAIAMIVSNVAGLIEVYWILKILTFRWDMLKPVVAGGVASVVGLLLLCIIHVGYGLVAIGGTLALVIPFMLTYVFTLAMLRFSKEDKIVLNYIFSKLGIRSK
jgi:hypothetical protein